MAQVENFEVKTLSTVWINSPYPVVTLGLEKMLEAKTSVHGGQEPPVDEAPSAVIFYPGEEDIGSEVRLLRDLAPDASILVCGLHIDAQYARAALLAGADGFIHLGMQPAQVVRALTATSKNEILVPRDLLGAFLKEKVSRASLPFLNPRQREFLELVVASATSEDDLVVPRELLKAFLMEEAAAM